MKENKSTFKIIADKPTVNDLQKDLRVDERIVLEQILNIYVAISMRDWIDSAQGQVIGEPL